MEKKEISISIELFELINKSVLDALCVFGYDGEMTCAFCRGTSEARRGGQNVILHNHDCAGREILRKMEDLV